MQRKTMLAAALALVACLGGTLADSRVEADELRIGVRSEAVSLDPHFSLQPPDMQIARNFFDNLIFFDAKQHLVPGLAESWSQIDEQTWEFKLRHDVKWHDGSPFTADDVIFSFSRTDNIEGATNSPLRFYTSGNKSAEKIDDYTVRVSTDGPYVLTPEDIAVFGIVSRKHGEGATPDDYNSGKAMVGTGPYTFVEWVPGDRIVMDANPDYWGGKPTWDRVIIKPIKADASRVAALLNGDVDMIDYVPVSDIAQLRANDDIAVHMDASNRSIYLVFDSNRDISPFVTDMDDEPLFPNPLRDQRVRQAISMAIDRTALADKIMEGVAIPAEQFLPLGFFGTTADLAVQAYDPDGAKSLLEAAGYADGFKMTIHGPNDRYPNDTKIVQAVAQMLARIGIAVAVETMPRSVYFPSSRNFEFSFGLWGYSTDTGEVASWINNVLGCYNKAAGRGSANVGRYCNNRLDALLDEALVTVDPAAREALLQEATKIGVADVAIAPLYYQVNAWATRGDLAFTPRTDEYTLGNDVTPAN
jgi:peptide/nickel transport system substrate-binding protein